MKKGNKRVLVVDDEYWVRNVVSRMLVEAGYRVREAPDGESALQILRLGTIDLMLIDMIMPQKDGADIIIECKKQFPDLGIIAMSGALYRESYLKTALELKIDATLQKPFSQECLIEAIEKLTLG